MTRHARPKWHEAYDAQMALWRWYRTPQSIDWLRGIYRSGVAGVSSDFRQTMSRMYDGEMGRLIESDPIFVAAEFCELVDHARHDFEPEPLRDYDLPTPRAFVYFETPIVISDRHGNPLPIRAFSWGQEYEAVDTTDATRSAIEAAIGDQDAADRYGDRITIGESEALVSAGLIQAYGITVTVYSDRDQYVEVAAARASERNRHDLLARLHYESAGTPLVPAHLAPWQYGMSFEGNEVDMNGDPTGAREWWQLLQTTLRLMQQKIRPRGFGRPDRATRRTAERLGFRPDTEVVIVRLRTEETERSEPSGESANYSHRFIVGRHWRNQWYPSEKVHRQILIMPYVKGPQDKPLLVRPRRVFQWTR